MLSKIPRNRFVLVEELASLVAWMSSEENSYTTGATFDLSGGRATINFFFFVLGRRLLRLL